MCEVDGKAKEAVSKTEHMSMCRQPACEPFFRKCEEHQWQYLLRFKEGSIPTVGSEYRTLREIEHNRKETRKENGRYWYDHVCDIDYKGYKINKKFAILKLLIKDSLFLYFKRNKSA